MNPDVQSPNPQPTPQEGGSPNPGEQPAQPVMPSVTPDPVPTPSPEAVAPAPQAPVDAQPATTPAYSASDASVQPPTTPVVPPTVQGGTPASHTDTFGIVSIVLAFFAPLVGLIFGIIGKNKAKKEGYDGKLSKIGIILNAVFMILGVLFLIFYIVLVVLAVNSSTTSVQLTSSDTQNRTDLNSMQVSLEEYYNENGTYPATLDVIDFTSLPASVVSSVNVVTVKDQTAAKAEISSNTDGSEFTYAVYGCVDGAGCKGYVLGVELNSPDSYTGYNYYEKTGLNNY